MLSFRPFLLALLALASPQGEPAPPEIRVPSFPNTTCPIMGKPISSRLWVDTEKGRIWVCCKGCNEEILADVDAAHRAAYPLVRRLELERCPRTHEPLPEDAPTVVLQGYEIPLCCAPCAADLRRESQLVLARLLEPALVDLRNAYCPIDGAAVLDNAFFVLDGTLVRLSDPRHLEQASRAPRETLARARALVAERGALPRPACPRKEKARGEAEKGEGGSAPGR